MQKQSCSPLIMDNNEFHLMVIKLFLSKCKPPDIILPPMSSVFYCTWLREVAFVYGGEAQQRRDQCSSSQRRLFLKHPKLQGRKNHTKIRAAGLRGEISAPYPHFKMCSKGTKKNSYAATFSSYVQDVFTCNMLEQSVPI